MLKIQLNIPAERVKMRDPGLFKNILYSILDVLFPSKCVVCGKGISNLDNCVCPPCLNEIESLKEKCPVCSGALIDGRCSICSDKKWYIKENISIGEYSGTLKEILHAYKFNKRKKISSHLAEIAFTELCKQNLIFDLITFVPMNRKKKWERGFNQSELIAKNLSKRSTAKCISLLYEKHGSATQRDLRYKERFLNVINRYSINKAEYLKDRIVLLIDDIFTTGATINECARILKDNGAKEVYSLTIARAKLQDFIS